MPIAAAVAGVPVLGRRGLVAASLGAFTLSSPSTARPLPPRVSVTVATAAVPVAPDRRAAFALAALRAAADIVCLGVTVVATPAGPGSSDAILVEGDAMASTGQPLRVVQWLWWRQDGRTVRVLLIAARDRVASAKAAVEAALA